MIKRLNYKYLLIVLFTVAIFLSSWICDDAFHGFVMVQNLLDGNGFVYNVGERVNAATCPLFYLLIAGISFFTKELFFTTIIFCTILSTISYSIILINCCKEKWQSFALTFILLFCNSFNAFATSGLENSLLFLEEILFFYVLVKHDKYNFKQLLLLSFICGCLLITRTDAGLLLFFVTAYCFLFKRDCSIGKMFFSGILGLMPFIGWSIFSWFYYGLIFPNTFYAKLNTGLDLFSYIEKGISYFVITFFYDCLVIVIPVIAMIILFIQKDIKLKLLGFGFLIKLIYTIYIGGDFMIGRHFTDIFILGMFIILYFINKETKENVIKKLYNITTYFIMGAVAFTVFCRPIISKNIYPNVKSISCCEERLYYYNYTGMIPYFISLTNNEISYEKLWNKVDLNYYNENDIKGTIFKFAPGVTVLDVVQDIYVTDSIGLGDPLFSKIPAIQTKNWRVGHIRRQIPDGYSESIYLGENVIEHPSLHKYYDIFHSIISDDLFNRNRINLLIDYTLGKYDYLIDEYIEYTKNNKIYHYKPYACNFMYKGEFIDENIVCCNEGIVYFGEFNNNDNFILLDNEYKLKIDYDIETESLNNYLEIYVNDKTYKYLIDKNSNSVVSNFIDIKESDNVSFKIFIDNDTKIILKDIYLERKN